LCSILDHNTLMGSIPRAIGKLQNLTVLNLSTNQLMGPIPSEIGDMRKISTMYCSKSYDQLLFLSTFNFEVHNPHLLTYALETFARIG
jgi:Leucine-rich repeat (LRR) protein